MGAWACGHGYALGNLCKESNPYGLGACVYGSRMEGGGAIKRGPALTCPASSGEHAALIPAGAGRY